MPDNEKLTPAAQDVLQEMVAEFRDELLTRAERNAATPSGEVREVTVRDLLYAVNQIRGRESLSSASSSDYLPYVAVLALMVVGVLGLTVLLYTDAAAPPVLVVVASLVGMLTAMASVVFVGRMRRIRFATIYADIERDLTVDYLRSWIEFETFIRSAATDVLGDSIAGQPIGRLFEKLSDVGIMRESEVAEARRFLDIRNQVAHGGRAVGHEELLDASRTLLRIREAVLDRH